MNPFDLEAFENIAPFLRSPDFLAAWKAEVAARKFMPQLSPELLEAHRIATIASAQMNIAELNSVLSQLNQFPTENFQAIKQTVTQNRSKLRDAANDNYKAVSDMVEQASESGTDETLSISEAIAQLLTDLDDSIELPKPDSKQIIHIDKSNIKSYINAVSLLISILGFILAIYQGQSATKLSEQQHAEVMQEQHKQISLQERQIEIGEEQIQLEKQQIEIEKQQAEYLRQIAENPSPDSSADR